MKINKNVEIEVELSSRELSELFWKMTDAEQALFFNELGNIINFDYAAFSRQMAMVSNKELTDSGRQVMKIIGEYSEKI